MRSLYGFIKCYRLFCKTLKSSCGNKRRAAAGEDTQAMKKAVELLGGIESAIDSQAD
mgnify:CR=1 FL=1